MTRTVREVKPSDAYAMAKKGVLLVDVREPVEIARKAYDVPNILHMPMSRFQKEFPEIPSDRKVIIACRQGNRSMAAARFLMERGYRKVVNLQHGIIQWEREGLPVKSEPQRGLLWRLLRMFKRTS